MKILTVCPSRGRPIIAKRMAESFKATSNEDNTLVFFLDEDDETISEYMKIEKISYRVNPRMTNTKIFNLAFSEHKNCEYYHMTNDDFIYRTEGWDNAFIRRLEKIGIAYGNDLLQGQGMATAPFISGDIVRALGWLQMPTLDYLGGDVAWQHIGHKLDRLFYLPQVIIEHMSYQGRKAEIDETYKNTNSPTRYEKDGQAFKEWVKSGRAEVDLLHVRLACGL